MRVFNVPTLAVALLKDLRLHDGDILEVILTTLKTEVQQPPQPPL